MTTELLLEAPTDYLEKLTALLPLHLVRVRAGGIVSPCVRSHAVGILSNALARGHLIDKSNGDEPVEEWDGWLVIDTPGHQTFIETSWKAQGAKIV